MEDATLKIGMLMEAAQTQQALAETILEKLRHHLAGLDDVVRDQVRRALAEEFQALGNESRQAAEALRRLRRAANVSITAWSLGVSVLCSAIPLGASWWLLPSQNELAALRSKRDELQSSVTRLERLGARADLRRCGERLCVRIDRKAPAYGEAGDYLVIKGY